MAHFLDTLENVHTSSHQLEIEIARYARIHIEERICQLCHLGVESEERYGCHCTVFCRARSP